MKLHVLPWTPSGYAVFLEGESPLENKEGSVENPYTFKTLRGAEKFVVDLVSGYVDDIEIFFHDDDGRIINQVSNIE